jgi:hypothetical protein
MPGVDLAPDAGESEDAMKRFFFVPVLGAAALAIATPVSAQIGSAAEWSYADEARQPYVESRRVAYDNGYREGLREGERDGRRRDAFEYRDERTWQRGDQGYHRTHGDRERYQQSFRSGYVAGYTEAYRRFSPNYGGYGNGPGGVYPNRGGSYGYPQGGYGYPDRGYPDRGYPGGYGNNTPAYSNGVSDGYEKGREDARDRDAFNPRRHKWYRDGDRHYRSSYGPRQRYEDIYREGFLAGYDRGYREWSYRR